MLGLHFGYSDALQGNSIPNHASSHSVHTGCPSGWQIGYSVFGHVIDDRSHSLGAVDGDDGAEGDGAKGGVDGVGDGVGDGAEGGVDGVSDGAGDGDGTWNGGSTGDGDGVEMIRFDGVGGAVLGAGEGVDVDSDLYVK